MSKRRKLVNDWPEPEDADMRSLAASIPPPERCACSVSGVYFWQGFFYCCHCDAVQDG